MNLAFDALEEPIFVVIVVLIGCAVVLGVDLVAGGVVFFSVALYRQVFVLEW